MSDTDFVPTRGSSLKKKAAESFEVVVFESYKPKNKKPKTESSREDEKNANNDNEFNIKRAKHEIVKFAVSGMEGSEKEEAKVRLAIQLGAKPKKNKYKNYKQLKEERQKEKQMKLKEEAELGKDSMGRSNVAIKCSKYKKKEGTGGLLEVYGKVSKVEVAKKNEAAQKKKAKRK